MTIKELAEQNKKSYGYMKLFFEEIPKKEVDNSVIKTDVPLKKSKQIAREIVYNMTPKLIDYFDVYVKNIKFESGSFKKSIYDNISYGENIIDVYTIVHEFYNYYTYMINKHGFAGIPYILNLSKSMMAEEIARKLILDKKVNLKEYNINPSKEEINYLKKYRLFDERKGASRAVFLHNIFLLDEHEDLKKHELITKFEEKGKNSIEYRSYKENNDEKIFYYLGNSAIYLNDYSETKEHPISYLIALDLLDNSNNKDIFESILYLFYKNRNRKLYESRNIKDIEREFNYSIIKDLSFDETKEEVMRKVIKNEYKSIIN